MKKHSKSDSKTEKLNTKSHHQISTQATFVRTTIIFSSLPSSH